MKKNKKLLMYFLALNVIVSSHMGAAPVISLNSDKMYNRMIRNIEKGKTNEGDYKVIERILKQKNKELKDLYSQNDYVVKSEYLEWQFFFTGFYDEYGKGRDNTSENAIYHTKVEGYYDDTNGEYIVTKGSINGLSGKPHKQLQQSKKIDLGITIQVREPNRQPILLEVTNPSRPLVTPGTPEEPVIERMTPILPPLTSFLVPNIGSFTPSINVNITPPTINTINISSFNPVTPNVTPPDLPSPPNFSILLGADCNTGCNSSASTPRQKAANGRILHYTWNYNTTGPESSLAFKMLDETNTSGTYTLSGNNTLDSYNNGVDFGSVVNSRGRDKNHQVFFVGGSRAVEADNGDGTVVNAGTLNLKGILTLGLVSQGRSFKMVNDGTITDLPEGNDSELDTFFSKNTTKDIFFPNESKVAVKRTSDGYVGYKVGIALVQEDPVTQGNSLTNNNVIDFRGANSIGMYTYLPTFNAANSMMKNTGDIQISGKESYGMKFGATGSGGIINDGIITLRKNPVGDDKSDLSAGIAVMDDETVRDGVNAGTGKIINNNIINITDNVSESIGMYLRIRGNNDITNSSTGVITVNSTGSGNVGMRVDAGTKDIGGGNPLAKNEGAINVGGGSNFGMIANSNNLSAVVATIQNIGTASININSSNSAGMYSTSGGMVENSGIISVTGSNSIGIFSTTTAANKMTAGVISLTGQGAAGVYNSGIFTLSGGTITSKAENSIGVYSLNTTGTNITGGNISENIIAQNGGVALYSGENSTINLSGPKIAKINSGGLLFYNYDDGVSFTGKYNIDSGTTASIASGGLVMYMKVNGVENIGEKLTNLKSAFINPTNLDIVMSPGSNILYVDGILGLVNISDLSDLAPGGMAGFFNFSGSGYNEYVMKNIELTLNNTLDSNLDSGAYGNIQFIQSNVTVNRDITVSGTHSNQVAIAQKNSLSGTLTERYITNNGTISLTGDQSTGIAGDYITMTNTATGQIKIGEKSTGMYTANGSKALNEGLIELKAGSVGMYGRNYFDGTTNSGTLGYGTDKIDITNAKDIKTESDGVTGNVTGVYINNILTLTDSSVNLTSTSNINLKGTGDIVGVFVGKTNLTSNGTITVQSDTGGNAVGIYSEESSSTSLSGSIKISGGVGTGIYLKNSDMSSEATITIENVTKGIGMYVEATSGKTSTGTNSNEILIGKEVIGMYGKGSSMTDTGTIINNGTIKSQDSGANKVIGLYVGSNGIAVNEGDIYLTAVGNDKDQVGVYNDSGIFKMTNGNIEVYSPNSVGLYAKSGTTNILSSGVIKTGKGAIGLYADNTTIQLSGTYKSIVDNGGIFALNSNGGDINIPVGNNIVVEVKAGGMGFSLQGALNTYLSSLITGGGTLEIDLKAPTSKLAILNEPGTILLSSINTSYVPGAYITPQVRISPSSNPNYTPFSITKGTIIVDQAVSLDNTTDSYNKSDFINSSVDINDRITGTNLGQLAVGQINYGTGSAATDRARITLNNNNTIDLSGNNSTGILADFGDIANTSGSFIKVTGEESIGIYAANSTVVNNTGTVNIGNKSVGIYGVNQLSGTPNYGNGMININNNGNIISTGTTHGGYGIYANNTVVPKIDSKITLGTGSNIDVSNGDAGIGVYTVASTLHINGNITVGKNGVGVYASESEGYINGGTISLNGDNAVGYYLTNGSIFTNNAGSITVNGQNITLMITDLSSRINLTIPFIVTSTPGSTYVVGNMIGGDFYNNTSVTLGSNGSLINGIRTVALFGTGSNINSSGTNVSGMVLSGQYAGVSGHTVAGSAPELPVNEEGTNRGTITLGNSSAGIYLTDGARGRNEGIISVNNNSVGIYAERAGSYIVNHNGIVNIGEESTGLFLKDGVKIENTGTAEINSTSKKAVGMYSENSLTGSTMVSNDKKIDLSGEQSIGIYTTGENNITNSGTILMGNSLSTSQPGVGIYANHIDSNIVNTSLGTIKVGDNSIGIYNLNGSITNNNIITAGNGGTGIYSDGGTIILNAGSSITVGQNNAVGVYAVNQTGTIINNSILTVGDGSYGFVFTGTTTTSFTNNQSSIIGNNSIFVFSDSVLSADNRGILTMTGSDNIGYYLKNGGAFINNANIIGNIGVSNIGVYAKDTNITNNADIILGNSNLIEHTDFDGKKYKTGYSVGIYGENSNIKNNSGKIIQVGKEGVGIYVKGTGYTAENYGVINGVGDDSKGIFATDGAIVRNYGIINMTGNNVMGIVGQNGAQIYNDINGIINVTGSDVTGIYLAGDGTKLVNNGQINISGTGLGIAYTSTVNQNYVEDNTGTTQGYTSKKYDLPDMPTLINKGEINIKVGDNFNYDGIKVIVTVDPSKPDTSITNSSSQVGFGGVIPDKLEIAPDFAVGTASDRYIFEDIFRGTNGKGDYISQSLTWDATARGSDIVMTRKAYTDFTDGLWFEDFGRNLNEKYAVTYGEGRKIYDKINFITNETDFRHIMASLAGNIYANINQRENDISRTFENSLDFIENTENNTKENIKINVIGGKGKNKEETDGVVGYDYTTTGVLALREVERTYKHKFGYSLGYLHTGFEFKDGNKSEERVDTIQLGVHNKYKSNNWILKNDLTGRVSIHNTDRYIDWPSPSKRSKMNGTYETYSVTSDNKLGREFELGKRSSITTYAGLRAMYVTRPTFSESGLEALEVEGNDAWSVKPRAGVELQTTLPIGNTTWQVKGTVDLAYEYELADLNEREKSKLVAIEDGYHKLSKPEDEKGTFRAKASVGVEIKERYGIFLTGEYLTGEDKEDDYRAGVTLKAVF